MASENSMILAIKRKLKDIEGVQVKKIWSSATNRDIDLLIVVYGLACFYEIKVPGKKPTSWQFNRLAYWAVSGAETGWYDNVDDLVERIQQLADQQASQDVFKNIKKAAMWRAAAVVNSDETSKR
jgi:hypothetical protein